MQRLFILTSPAFHGDRDLSPKAAAFGRRCLSLSGRPINFPPREKKNLIGTLERILSNKSSDKMKSICILFLGYRNCAELYKAGQRKSGVYTINPDNAGAFDVYCDQTTAGGGWTVLQKRLDGSVDFYRGWDDYKRGFGNLNGEFWLGLDKIHRLTILRSRLRVDLEDTNGKTAYAEYDFFGVSSERSKYKLSLGTYSGTAGDSLGRHRGYGFTTKDRDNDSWNQNCASRFKGAWWYSDCIISSLNGVYLHGKHSKSWEGMVWVSWKGANYSVKRAEMKIRPVKA
ncbi:fibrinogen C domain-containing protein 1-like isoform X2 [Porites lutea]